MCPSDGATPGRLGAAAAGREYANPSRRADDRSPSVTVAGDRGWTADGDGGTEGRRAVDEGTLRADGTGDRGQRTADVGQGTEDRGRRT